MRNVYLVQDAFRTMLQHRSWYARDLQLHHKATVAIATTNERKRRKIEKNKELKTENQKKEKEKTK